MRAQREFAVMSMKEGVKPAFLEYLAPEGVVFQALAASVLSRVRRGP